MLVYPAIDSTAVRPQEMYMVSFFPTICYQMRPFKENTGPIPIGIFFPKGFPNSGFIGLNIN
ncbi:hypothetical protein RB2501_12132 [Robiginitalea biformata HTCC2501]|uniref:Uncharacterized protein n=1 Tax=Robiginitalea biformata (strain ATCC BAA-864 / DSM 15991 / KCTC 12146 / HTCC2501) TaxID=313596 RepID=A4CN33_ROBBH|nr:hypothetical protein RB2501_12132 [Robiginitalea biformata HTCC2501]